MSPRFKMPVGRMMYVLMVAFVPATVLLTVLGVMLWTEAIQTTPPMTVVPKLIFGVVMPLASFLATLYPVKCIFFNYHELTDRELIVSTPPFHVRVPLEEIDEIVTDAGMINPSLGKTVKYRETRLDGFKGGGSKFYGATVTHSGGKTVVQSVFDGKNLVLIRARRHEITTNMPDPQEFAGLASKAIQKRKLETVRR